MPEQPNIQGQLKRYPGVKPFTTNERNLFFGREEDVENLYNLLFIKQSVVLYGKSGYGKSSLINAGIIPKLQDEDEWKYLSIRFNNFSSRGATENVSPVQNVKLNPKKGLDVESTSLLDQLITDEGSFWYWVKAHQSKSNRFQFIIFFDQFEELFTYPQKEIDEFSEQISQLLYISVPINFRKRLAEKDKLGEISESLYQYINDKPTVKVVFSVRSDRLSLLNLVTDRHPNILKNMFELAALSKQQAREAITKPAQAPQSLGFSSPSFNFSEETVQKILDGITDAQTTLNANDNDKKERVETATLQIICRYVEDELVMAKNITNITGEDLGPVKDIFKKYYEGILAKLDGDDRKKAQRLIEDELIEDGKRNTLTDLYIKRKFGSIEKLLQQLEQSSLLRKELDAAGRILYEISHDTLVEAIEKVAEGRREIEKEAKQKDLEEKLQDEKNKTDLLTSLNQKAKTRTRIAVALALVSLVVALLAFNFYKDLKTAANNLLVERDSANKMSIMAKMQENKARIELYKNNFQRAKSLLDDVRNSYLLSGDYELGLKNLSIADSLLLINITLPTKEERERKDLLMMIDENRDSCYHLKNNPS